MRGWLTGLTIATCLVGFPALARGQEHPAEPGLDAFTRVRSRHPLIQALILRGSEQSPTFHRLMKAIEASEGIVYIDAGVCRRGVRACLVNVTSAGGYRLLFVKVSTKRADPNLIAAIGHELQHAVEVLSNPAVTGHSSLYYFYKHNRERAGTATAFETQAATDAGHAIANEVRQRQRTTVKK